MPSCFTIAKASHRVILPHRAYGGKSKSLSVTRFVSTEWWLPQCSKTGTLRDDGYMGNPAMFPLTYNDTRRDIMPLHQLPQSAPRISTA